MNNHNDDEIWFDREMCPCGTMHERFRCCGAPVERCGLENRHAAAILQDLIAELREGHPTFGDEPPLWVKTALYAAENRLRKSTRDD